MNTKKMILASLSGFIAMTLISLLWHGVILDNWYDEQFAAVGKDAPNAAILILAYLILGFVMAYVYPIGYKGGSPAKEGLRFGIFVGLVWFCAWLVVLSVWNFPTTGTLIDATAHVIEKGIGGVIIALIYGSGIEVSSS